MSIVVLYCWCHSDSASVLLYFTFVYENTPERVTVTSYCLKRSPFRQSNVLKEDFQVFLTYSCLRNVLSRNPQYASFPYCKHCLVYIFFILFVFQQAIDPKSTMRTLKSEGIFDISCFKCWENFVILNTYLLFKCEVVHHILHPYQFHVIFDTSPLHELPVSR